MTKKRMTDFPEDDPPRPYPAPNPFNMPDAPMHPTSVPTREQVERRGGDYLQAEMTGQVPTVLLDTWPSRLKDALYTWMWENHHGRGDLYLLIAQFDDKEIVRVAKSIGNFVDQGGQFHHIGRAIYDGLIAEAKRRAPHEFATRDPIRIKVQSRQVHDDDREPERAPELPERAPILLPASSEKKFS